MQGLGFSSDRFWVIIGYIMLMGLYGDNGTVNVFSKPRVLNPKVFT